MEDVSKITDPMKNVDDHKDHTCDVCRKEKSVKEFVIYGLKYNPKLSKACRVCNGYPRFKMKKYAMKNVRKVSIKKNSAGMGIYRRWLSYRRGVCLVKVSHNQFSGYLIQNHCTRLRFHFSQEIYNKDKH